MFLVLVVITAPLLLIYLFLRHRNEDAFKNNWKIKYTKPSILFGHSYSIMAGKEHLYEFIQRIYNEFPNEKAVGLWDVRTPTVMVRDPELLKFLTVTKIDHFLDRKAVIDDKADPFFGNMLGALKGQKWKAMRATLSPAFTGSKMRLMLELITDVTEQLVTYLKSAEHGADSSAVLEYDMKEICSRNTNDIIALCAFGIRVDSLKDKDNEFYTIGKELMDLTTLKMSLKFAFIRFFPRLSTFLKISIVSPSTRNFFSHVILSTMEHRQKNNISRPDMISLLMEVKDKPSVTNDGRQWSIVELIAQCYVFFLGGFENNSTLMTLAAYELAINPEVQVKLYEEVKAMDEQLRGAPITYEDLHKMKYLDAVICETLRRWPPAAFSDRVCTKSLVFEDEDSGLEMHFNKGNAIWIPIYALHHDKNHFPEPIKFLPERFLEVNDGQMVNREAFLPFGIGPRICPATRFVFMAVKAFLYQLVLNFEMVPVKNTRIPLVLKKDFTSISKDIHLGLKRR